ncbi:MAG: AAA family ATPase [Gammaproteobacteria bacterium]|nr:AAA family ATPase [Gammaproteobacteria bacterium]
MPKRILAERVSRSLNNICSWRESAKSQAATHLFPMLALIERGAGQPPGTATLMRETPHEFDFWNKYFRLNDGDLDKPYFNPITLRRAEAGFPHSNSATIRKNTFAGKWHAAQRNDTDDGENWILAEDYADIFREKVLKKGQSASRVPVLDLAVLMFRNEEFPDTADANELQNRFRQQFQMRNDDYEKIFVLNPEANSSLFEESDQPQDYESAIKGTLVEDARTATSIPTSPPISTVMNLDDPILVQVQKLLSLGTSGIIFTGAPGTGKSYYAKRVAKHLVRDVENDLFKVQFHPSYGYEDFVEGYRPDQTSTSGFQIVDKTFMLACARATELKPTNGLVVLIVDEINRGDPARIFGELLTYIERTYRGENFTLPFSGRVASVPDNLIFLGTMNPYDRSISQVDAAFVRRFDHIEVAPSREVAEELLERTGCFTASQINLIGSWFETLQKMVPFGIGHSFFADIKNLEHLKLVWRYRMRPSAQHAIELNDGAIGDVTSSFDALIRRIEGAADDA